MSDRVTQHISTALDFEQRQRATQIEEWCQEYPDEAAERIVAFNDRLAAPEQSIRALADELEREADSRTMVSGVSVAVSQEKRESAARLRALLNESND